MDLAVNGILVCSNTEDGSGGNFFVLVVVIVILVVMNFGCDCGGF